MKNIFKLLFVFITITSFLFVMGLVITLVPTFVLFILKFVIGYSWGVVFIPTYIVMVLTSFVGVVTIFSPKLRRRVLNKRKFKSE
jgi:hypothetical protein